MRSRQLMFFINFLAIYTAINLYIGWNAWVWLHTLFPMPHPFFFIVGFGILSYSYLIGRGIAILSFLRVIGACWFAIVQYALFLLPCANLIVLLLYLLGVHVESTIIWAGVGVLLGYLLLFGYGIYQAYHPVVRNYTITIAKKVDTYPRLRIAMASDMHFGRLSGKAHLRRLIGMIKHIEPDIILLAGDIIDDELQPFMNKKMNEMMKELKAPLGVYGVLGNHEYYGGQISRFIKEMKKIGISILMDEVLLIRDSFYLLGRKDKADRNRKSIAELTAHLDQRLPLIMVDHQPYELEQAMENGVDLSLSGHTHRGQMAPNHLITRKIYELDWGYKQKDQLHAIVSSGFGFWGPPLRIGSQSEVVQIDIIFSKPAD